jgi:NMD protein affecting ribosome stability and mRNA decay
MQQKMGRGNRLIKEKRHDPYQEKGKLPEPTVCSECGAVFLEGRWSWWEAMAKSHVVVCPACQRIKDKFPAGYLEITGAFFADHREEIDNLLRNIEQKEKAERPMERIMAITPAADHTLITTTGIHLARRFGEALKNAYQGELSFTYGDGEKTIRLSWNRS